MGVFGPIPVPDLGPIQPFGLLVATGVLLGTRIVFWRSKQRGLGEEWPRRGVLTVLAFAFLLSHWVERLYYIPGPLFETGPLEFLAFWSGMSSFGGFVGALYGLLLFTGWDSASKNERGVALVLPPVAALLAYASLPVAQIAFPVTLVVAGFLLRRTDGRRIVFADAALEGLVPGWVFGRMGCSLVFDHPGAPSDWTLAMIYPPDGLARHNLGLYEMLFTLLLLWPLVLILRKVDVKRGVLTAAVSIAYAPVRFVLDFYRVHDLSGADPRYFGLTAAQFTAVALLLGGLSILVVSLRAEEKPLPEPVEPVPPGSAPGKAKGSKSGKKKGRSKKKRR